MIVKSQIRLIVSVRILTALVNSPAPIGRDERGRSHDAQHHDVAREHDRHDEVPQQEPPTQSDESPDLGDARPGDAEPLDPGPDDEDVGRTPEHGGHSRRHRQAADPEPEVDGDEEERLAHEDEQDGQTQPLVPEVLPLQDRLRQVEQAEQDRVEDQDPRGYPDRPVGSRGNVEPDRREPRQRPPDRDEQREEEQPDRQCVAHLPPLEVVVRRSLFVSDRPFQGLSGPAARRRGVADQALEHLPDPERRVAELGEQEWADDQPGHDPRDLFGSRGGGVQRRLLRETAVRDHTRDDSPEASPRSGRRGRVLGLHECSDPMEMPTPSTRSRP
jgi:hypothetical protein